MESSFTERGVGRLVLYSQSRQIWTIMSLNTKLKVSNLHHLAVKQLEASWSHNKHQGGFGVVFLRQHVTLLVVLAIAKA